MLFLMFPLLMLSCELSTDWELQDGEAFIVADCIVTNEFKYHELRLYRSSRELNHLPEGFSGVTAELNDGFGTTSFTEDPEEPGRYVSTTPFIATAGTIYRLTLRYGEFADTAYASMTGVSPLSGAEIIPSDGYFRLVYQDSPDASMTEVHYDWSADQQYTEQTGRSAADEVFYTLDNIDIGKLFAPEKQVILFPHNTQIIRRKYALSEDHQRFVRSLLLETEWRGGFFDVEQGNLPTNFHHGVQGWFAACSVVSDTTFFE